MYGIPPPKRLKSVWKTVTKSKFDFSRRIFELGLDTFQHHQLESVQREQLKIQITNITRDNDMLVAWMDYPENASIIDPKEQQSDYYDRYYIHDLSFPFSFWTFLKQLSHLLGLFQN
jgi:hypothetical protein